jgi:xylitol oxidase
MAPSVVQSSYEKLADFKQLIRQHDPNGKFHNEYLSLLD